MICTFIRRELVKQGADPLPGCLGGPFRGIAQQMLELGKDLFDWIEVRAIGRKEQEVGHGPPDRLPDGTALVGGEVVHHHDVARCQCRCEEAFDIDAEGITIDRPVEDKRGVDTIDAQGGNERHGLPVAVRCMPDQALAPWRPAAQRRHVGLCPGLVNEDQAARVNSFLVALPALAAAGDVRLAVARRPARFFLNEYPAR